MTNEFNLRKFWAEAAAKQERYVEEGEESQLAKIRDGYHGLKALGWADATYCPKDGTRFLAICGNGSEPRPCTYQGEWPNGTWWIEDAGDLWPERPILWKPMPKGEQE
jgi:hypothetical protein